MLLDGAIVSAHHDFTHHFTNGVFPGVEKGGGEYMTPCAGCTSTYNTSGKNIYQPDSTYGKKNSHANLKNSMNINMKLFNFTCFIGASHSRQCMLWHFDMSIFHGQFHTTLNFI